ncbi:hypothetical protein CVD27_15755 [Neobacillus cucumis]|uniref:Uncharacterized protein n=1 Tax=Neobacillus cucumis TaxID=1740721 RepID=A0A2N5HC69_9BACI|nr:hypothetical protein CVD27_15755 [Neobacillus cucumis]
MYFLYWFFKCGWLLLIIFIGNIYLSRLGLWSVMICIAIFLVGNYLINKGMEKILFTKKKNS